MKIILIIALSIISINALPQGFTVNTELNDEWEIYKTNFKRSYDSLVELTRRLIWEDNLKYIQQHNLEYDLGQHSYFLGINEFSDMTHEEFSAKYLGTIPPKRNNSGSFFMAPENMGALPSTVDWRNKGYVTPVKNQGQCGSCWSFSTTGSLEGQQFRKTGTLPNLSEQQLVDCSGSFGNNGCGGGLMDNAFKYIQQFGLELETDYPYVAKNDVCKYDASKALAKCTGFTDIARGNEKALAKAVATVGPVSVAIDASHKSFQSYKGGVYHDPKCSSSQLDHGVLTVGYGIEIGKHYWLVKNSWGPIWGLSGYIKMLKDKHNHCGIASMASFPNV